LALTLLLVLAPPSAIGGNVIAKPAVKHPGVTGLSRSAAVSKAGARLAQLVSEYVAHVGKKSRAPFTPSDRSLQFSKDTVVIDARAVSSGADLLQDLEKLGLKQGARYGTAVSGQLPVKAVRKAAALNSLRAIHAAPRPVRNAGAVTSQGDVAMRADIARSLYGVDGSGVTVGVMSDSYNTLGGAAADIASGDLPAGGVTVINGESSICGVYIFCIDEGRAMLQIIHDIAPGAGLLFHTALSSVVDFANGITALAVAGADVIVDDLMYLNEPMFQDGIVAQAVDSAVAGGVAYYSAAGNQGRNGYEAPFRDSGEIFCIEIFLPLGDCHPLFERVGRMHDFDPGPGEDLYQSITIPENTTLSIALQWNEAFGSAQIDHDIVLLDETGGTYFEFGANDNVSTGEGWEVLQFTNYDFMGYGTKFTLIITYDDVDSIGLPATRLKTIFFGSGTTIDEFSTNSSTLIGHANAAGAAAVGAAFFLDTPAYGTTPPVPEPYSAAGGTPILFAASGSPLVTPEVRLKPEFTAIDGVNTTFFFDDSHGNDGIDDFFGTSAAAPHAAGVAALLLEATPGTTPAGINMFLQTTAIDMLGAGFDHDTGYGLVQADAALALLLDADGDGLSDALEQQIGTDPLLADTDGDGLTDYEEVAWDGDDTAYTPGAEPNPLVADTDMDGFRDGMEHAAGYDPLDDADFPVWGDINDDREVDAVDMLLATRAALGLLTLAADQHARGDVAPLSAGQPDPDGKFNTADVVVIQREALGLISLQP
jgi:subtilisin family serine protease